jgi:hypothetical protein
MDASTRIAIDALRKYDAISKAPRAAGYRGSDFVHWSEPDILSSLYGSDVPESVIHHAVLVRCDA